jgi:tetratricopeptide (TPR) repeat protein
VTILCAGAALLAAIPLLAQSPDRAEALWKQHRYREANDAFRAVVAASPKNPDSRVRWGRLLLERFNPEEAEALFREALELKKDHAGALLGLALVAADGFSSQAEELARQALAADPRLVEAQDLLARMALEDGRPDKAAAEARKALAIHSESVPARAILATIDWLDGKQDTSWDPKRAEGYAIAARFFVLNRRYEEGIAYYRKALVLDPELWSARAQLGVNLMRLGRDEEARSNLVQCYEHGYDDNATVNSLRLIDSYKNFVTIETPHGILKLHKKEAEALRPYLEAELERAIATYEKKYALRLAGRVRLEVYPDHEDFAVRTMGLPGLGALGVTFGNVVAMDSPSGRKPGSFHWASTLWHELSHVYTLSATRHRVPRWFTEGVAVYEETAASKEWGDRISPDVITAIAAKKLLPVAELDRGFVHPTSPAQVGVSYFQAGRICGYIAREWGERKLLAMLARFGQGAATADVVRAELALAPEEFDRRFLAAVEAETKKTVDGFEAWRKRWKTLVEAARAGNHDTVLREGAAIRDLYPDYVEAGSVYELLAEAYLALKRRPEALAELDCYTRAGGRDPALLKKYAALLEEDGRKSEAAAVLDRINYIQPLDEELHARLGNLWLEADNASGAIREFRAVLARSPIDPAAAHFNLARAYRRNAQPELAKEEVLAALEAAPGYRPAQKLLLEMSR